MKKRGIIALALSLVMLVSLLAACGGDTSSSTSQPQQSSSQTSSEPEAPEMVGNMYVEGLPIVEETQTFRIAVLNHAMDQKPFDQKAAVIAAEEATNVHIEWIPIPVGEGAEKINLMLATGDLPDAFLNAGLSDGALVQNLPAFQPLDELIAQYAPNVQAIYDEFPTVKAALTQADGKMYSIMTGQMTNRDTTSGLTYINQKWLDQLDLPMPTTVDELYDTLVAFRDNDPNGNGQKDEIPMAFCEKVWATFFEKYMAPWGIYRAGLRNETVIRDGEVLFSKSLPEFREALEFYNKLANEGLLDVEGFTQTEQQYAAKGQEGRYGVYLDYYPIYNAGEEYMNDYVVLLPLEGPNGVRVHDGNVGALKGTKTGFAITKNCENPEVLVRWIGYLNSSFEIKMEWDFGEKGIGWDGTEDEWWIPDGVEYPNGLDSTNYKFTEAMAERTGKLLTQDEMMGMTYPDQESVNYKRMQQVMEVEPFYPAENYINIFEDADTSARRSELFTEILAQVQTFTADAVVNGVTDESWQAYLSALESLGVEEYTQMWQDYYDRTK